VISTFPNEIIHMVVTTNSYDLATPGPLNAAGTGFAATWHNSQ
jgi:hypothetical protein